MAFLGLYLLALAIATGTVLWAVYKIACLLPEGRRGAHVCPRVIGYGAVLLAATLATGWLASMFS